MRITVRQDHINKGVDSDCFRCPVALALVEAIGHDNLAVGGIDIRIGSTRYYSPASVSNFVRAFDAGRTVKPFEFEIKELHYAYQGYSEPY